MTEEKEKGFLERNIEELIALIVTLLTFGVAGYQAVFMTQVTMPMEAALIIIGFFFGKRTA